MMDDPTDKTYDPNFMGVTMVVVNSVGFFALIFSLAILHPSCRRRVNAQSSSSSTQVQPINTQKKTETTKKTEGDEAFRSWGT